MEPNFFFKKKTTPKIIKKKKKKKNQPTLELTHCEFWNERIKEKKRIFAKVLGK